MLPFSKSCSAQSGITLDQVVDHVADGLAARGELASPSDLRAEAGRNADARHAPYTVDALQNST